jgi:hypothetical protein
MTRIMRDSTTLNDIPRAGTDIVAPYRNGMFSSTLGQVRVRFPTQPVAWIDVNGSAASNSDILDVETGDATPAGAALWAKARHLLHPGAYPPIIYCNRATLTPVFNAMNAAGLAVGPGFRLWVATLDGTKRIADMTGVTAVQYAGEAQTGGHYDESIVYDAAWLAPPPPVPAPVPDPVPGGVVRVADGHTSLRAALHAHGTGEVATGLELMLAAKASGRFGRLQRVYIDTGNWNADMPAGMLYVTAT